MACCVLMAALCFGAMGGPAWLLSKWRRSEPAQAWRLKARKDSEKEDRP
jgi:hypothetical protein